MLNLEMNRYATILWPKIYLWLPLLLLGLCANCSGTGSGVVRLTNDSFKKVKLYSLTLRVTPEEAGPVGNDRTARLDFFREQSSSTAGSVLTLTIKIDESDQDIRNEIYLKIDDVPHKVNLTNFVQNSISQTYPNSSGMYNGYTAPSSTLTTVRSKVFKGRIEFTKPLEEALKNCKSVTLRAYMGADALNLNFSANETDAIRRFFTGTPDETVSN